MQVNPEEKFAYLDEFRIIKDLGFGYHAEVKLGVDPLGKLFAIKRYKLETATTKTFDREIETMKDLSHENLIRLYDVRQNALYKKKDETSFKCWAIILEYAQAGQLFDFVAETGNFSDKIARTFFHQLMNGLYYMHVRGYAHRDLKPQNILLDRNFNLKIADFGFSCMLRGKDGSGILHTRVGTEGYMAPEIVTKNYRGTQTDIFAAGVILFIMYSGNPPFQKSKVEDPYYCLIKQKNYSTFWNAHSRGREKNFYSKEFKDLFVKMVAYDSKERPTIQQIAHNAWVRQPLCSTKQIREELKKRKEKMENTRDFNKKIDQLKTKFDEMPISFSVQKKSTLSEEGIQMRRCFLSIYEEERQIDRKLQTIEQVGPFDLVIEDNISYIVAKLKKFVQKLLFIQDLSKIDHSLPMSLRMKSLKDNKSSLEIVYEENLMGEVRGNKLEVKILLRKTKEEKNCLRVLHKSGSKEYLAKLEEQIKKLYMPHQK